MKHEHEINRVMQLRTELDGVIHQLKKQHQQAEQIYQDLVYLTEYLIEDARVSD